MVPEPPEESSARETAAITIQRAWRRNRASVRELTVDDRWEDAAMHTKLQTLRSAAEDGKNDPIRRWKRGAFLASRLQASGSASDQSKCENWAAVEDGKILEMQHWLELTDRRDRSFLAINPAHEYDSKHRYGSNLKHYHRRWQEEDTDENFFRWLDHGGGKDVSIPECSRERLEKERIVYLSPEQRHNYQVKVDEKGLLRWVRNNELVDTTAGRWRDSGDGSGIIAFDVKGRESPVLRRTSFEAGTARSSRTSIVSAGSQDSQSATHYVETAKDKNPIHRWIRVHLTLKGWTELLLRKTVRRNTWIYVADRHFNLYISIKETGTFQHSSFLAGGLVVSAGLISVHNGLIHKLSPLSGHYRTRIDNFRRFVKGLEERHVDLHRAEISRAELALWGIEHIKKFEKKKGDIEWRGKNKIKSLGDELKPSAWPTGGHDSQWRRDILLGRKRTGSRVADGKPDREAK